MKLATLKEKVEIIRGENTSAKNFSIDGKNMHLAIQAFYQYSDPIGSIIREITSNAYDAHIEAGTTKPVIVKIDKRNLALEVLDFGVGLSPDRVNEIFTKFFSSTKRETNDQIGAFGLGSKSPLSYTDMFEVISKYDEMVYEYIIHKADGVPNLVRVEERQWHSGDPWSQYENGTKIIIPFKKEDTQQLISSAKQQLCYFDGVVIEEESCQTYNKESIYKGEYLIYRETDNQESGLNRLHICMGKVYYPLQELSTHIRNKNMEYVRKLVDQADPDGKSVILEKIQNTDSVYYGSWLYNLLVDLQKIPMALYFDIGELPILWHRENIEYTDEAWERIVLRAFQALMEIELLQQKHIGNHNHNFKQALEAAWEGIKTKSSKVYLSEQARKVTKIEFSITELFNELRKEPSKNALRYAEPFVLMSHFYRAHKDMAAPYNKDMAEYLLTGSNPQNIPVFRLEKDENRKNYLKAYMEQQKWRYLIMINRNVDKVIEDMSLKLQRQASKDAVKKYAYEIISMLEEKIEEANSIEIPETFNTKTGKAQKQSEIPVMYRRFSNNPNPSYTRVDLKEVMDKKRSKYWTTLEKMPSMLIYGFQDDRKLLNMYCKANKGSLFRKSFGDNHYSSDNPPILGLISKDTATYIHEVCPSIYIGDFLYHRRALSNIVTRHLMALYFKKYPWFKGMLDTVKGSDYSWSQIQSEGLITYDEYKKLKAVEDVSFFMEETHSMYPYLLHGLEHRYYHEDEMQALRWAHGMYAKHARVLTNNWLKADKTIPGNQFYVEELLQQVPTNINPILYRKYHVKYIESRS